MTKNKKKRKNNAHHTQNPPPARPRPMDGRRQVSYEDLEINPTPPVPRHMVSYASSDDEADENPSTKSRPAPKEEDLPVERHKILSRESDGTYDAIRAQPRTDPTYGQVGAFPGLDTHSYAPFYGPANDGLDYLRMVRSEAREFPHIMHAKSRKPIYTHDRLPDAQHHDDDDEQATAAEEQMRQNDYAAYGAEEEDYEQEEEGGEDSGDGYYSDGAYVAKPLPASTTQEQDAEKDPQDAYYNRLKVLFSQHRARCRASPSADAISALDRQHPISYPHGSQAANVEWKNLLLDTRPLPAQLCSMDRWTVWRLLRLCERHIRSFAMRGMNIPQTLTLWIWGLLGRLDESWQMRNEEVSKVRELGKCATYCLARYRIVKERRDEEHVVETEEGWDYGEDDGDDAKVENLDEVEEQPELKDALGGPKNDNSIARDAPAAMPQPSNVEDGEIDMDTNPDGPVGGVQDMFAARRQQLQQANKETEQPPISSTTNAADYEEVATDITTNGQNQSSDDKDKNAVEPPSQEQFPSAQTSAVLDLIVTVCGEFYGQRDLLWSRHKWAIGEE